MKHLFSKVMAAAMLVAGLGVSQVTAITQADINSAVATAQPILALTRTLTAQEKATLENAGTTIMNGYPASPGITYPSTVIQQLAAANVKAVLSPLAYCLELAGTNDAAAAQAQKDLKAAAAINPSNGLVAFLNNPSRLQAQFGQNGLSLAISTVTFTVYDGAGTALGSLTKTYNKTLTPTRSSMPLCSALTNLVLNNPSAASYTISVGKISQVGQEWFPYDEMYENMTYAYVGFAATAAQKVAMRQNSSDNLVSPISFVIDVSLVPGAGAQIINPVTQKVIIDYGYAKQTAQ
ncbi:hypothetical protein EBZ39_11915 [bacterium]|nr:hypothetical protein [bacterium]